MCTSKDGWNGTHRGSRRREQQRRCWGSHPPPSTTGDPVAPENPGVAGEAVHTTLVPWLQQHTLLLRTGQERQHGLSLHPSSCKGTCDSSPYTQEAVPMNLTNLDMVEAESMNQATPEAVQAPTIWAPQEAAPATAATLATARQKPAWRHKKQQ